MPTMPEMYINLTKDVDEQVNTIEAVDLCSDSNNSESLEKQKPCDNPGVKDDFYDAPNFSSYKLTPNEVLSLAMEGVAYKDINMIVPTREFYLQQLRQAKAKSLIFQSQNDSRKPVSGIDYFILASFGYYPTYQDQAIKMWRVIQRKYKLKFHLNYLVHCTVYRLFRSSIRPDWKDVLCSPGKVMTTRLQVTKYCLEHALFQYEKDGLFMPLDIEEGQHKNMQQAVLNHLQFVPGAWKLSDNISPDSDIFRNTNPASYLYRYMNAMFTGQTCTTPYYIYCITQGSSRKADVLYVGQTSNMRQRINSHMNPRTMPRKLKQIWKQCSGSQTNPKPWTDIFSVFLLDILPTAKDATDKEQYFIHLFETVDKGANDLRSAPGQSSLFWARQKAKVARQKRARQQGEAT
mmetsp:Transcript_7034/g.14036  ORF Transcript_7034/g.14036 Transcript_7034/m.14036 type:complete len:404 (-) Transcript_7034:312-1523(-)